MVARETGGTVDLVCFVYLVSFVQPNKRDRPNKPNNGLLTLAGFFSILLRRPLSCRQGDATS